MLACSEASKPLNPSSTPWVYVTATKTRQLNPLTPSQNPQGTYTIPMIASSYTLGCWVLSTVYIWVGNPLGRKRSILLGDLFVIVGGALQASAWSVAQIIIARVLCGFGVGFISCTVPTYV